MTGDATVQIPGSLDLCGGELQNAKLQSLVSKSGATEADIWYDGTNHVPMYNNGTTDKRFGIEYAEGTGIDISNDTISVDTSVIAQQSDIPDVSGFADDDDVVHNTGDEQIKGIKKFAIDSNGQLLFNVYDSSSEEFISKARLAYVIGTDEDAGGSPPTYVRGVSFGGYGNNNPLILSGSEVYFGGTSGQDCYKLVNSSAKIVDARISNNIQRTNTAVTHTASTTVGSATQPVYIASDGTATETTYSLSKSVPSDAVFTDTTYSNGTGLTLTGTTFAIDTSTVALKSDIQTVYKASGTVASASDLPTLSASVLGNVYNVTASFSTTSDFVEGSGKTINVGNDIAVVDVGTGSSHSYKFSVMGDFVDLSGYQQTSTAVKYGGSSAVGSATKGVYIASDGTATSMTYSVNKDVPSNALFTDTDTKNTAGGDDTSSKIFLVGMTSQTSNNGTARTYTQDTAFVDANGRLNSANPASGANDTTVATTKWVKDQGYKTSISSSDVTTALGYTPAKKVVVSCPALTKDNDGVITWSISNTFSTDELGVDIYSVGSSSNKKIYPSIEVTSSTITVTMLSSSNKSAGDLKAVITG